MALKIWTKLSSKHVESTLELKLTRSVRWISLQKGKSDHILASHHRSSTENIEFIHLSPAKVWIYLFKTNETLCWLVRLMNARIRNTICVVARATSVLRYCRFSVVVYTLCWFIVRLLGLGSVALHWTIEHLAFAFCITPWFQWAKQKCWRLLSSFCISIRHSPMRRRTTNQSKTWKSEIKYVNTADSSELHVLLGCVHSR